MDSIARLDAYWCGIRSGVMPDKVCCDRGTMFVVRLQGIEISPILIH